MTSPNSTQHMIFIFVDGLGINPGEDGNPFTDDSLQILRVLGPARIPIESDGFICKGIDACLGMGDMPQSSTGQTALFTGINPKPVVQRHISGFPTFSLRKILHAHIIFRQLQNCGKTTLFANAYHREYFDRREAMLSATTHAVLATENPQFLMLEDLRRENAIFADITNDYLIREGYDIQRFTPEKAAGILRKISRQNDFVLFEIPFLDALGHKQDREKLEIGIRELDLFLSALTGTIPPDTLILMSSDHGNIEDLTVKTHTSNPVPLMVWGKGARTFSGKIESIEDITPAIIDYLK